MAIASEASLGKPGLLERLQVRFGRSWLTLPTTLFLVVVMIFPLVLVGLYSVNLMTNLVGVPTKFSLTNWESFLPPGSNPFWNRFKSSMLVTLVVSVSAVLAAYPVAYFLAFVARRRRYTLLLLILAPFFTSYLLRVIAWKVVLANNGVVNSGLWQLGLRDHGDGISWLIYSWFSVGLVLFYSWVPFVALPIYVVLERMDTRLLEAAQDLGASRLHAFRRITLPASLPGVISAFVFVLIPTTGEFIAPLLVGGPGSSMFGNSIQSFFSDSPNWNYGAVLAVWLIGVVLLLLVLFGRFLSTDVREARAR
ncbi:MAG: ABC transporter permease [Actinomycetota bacterium]|nr:ABC transporter permease [Actinomycetota bacterium]